MLLVAAVGGVILGSHAREHADEGAQQMIGPDVVWYLVVAGVPLLRPARSAC